MLEEHFTPLRRAFYAEGNFHEHLMQSAESYFKELCQEEFSILLGQFENIGSREYLRFIFEEYALKNPKTDMLPKSSLGETDISDLGKIGKVESRNILRNYVRNSLLIDKAPSDIMTNEQLLELIPIHSRALVKSAFNNDLLSYDKLVEHANAPNNKVGLILQALLGPTALAVISKEMAERNYSKAYKKLRNYYLTGKNLDQLESIQMELSNASIKADESLPVFLQRMRRGFRNLLIIKALKASKFYKVPDCREDLEKMNQIIISTLNDCWEMSDTVIRSAGRQSIYKTQLEFIIY